jgi:hypothetical protein
MAFYYRRVRLALVALAAVLLEDGGGIFFAIVLANDDDGVFVVVFGVVVLDRFAAEAGVLQQGAQVVIGLVLGFAGEDQQVTNTLEEVLAGKLFREADLVAGEADIMEGLDGLFGRIGVGESSDNDGFA